MYDPARKCLPCAQALCCLAHAMNELGYQECQMRSFKVGTLMASPDRIVLSLLQKVKNFIRAGQLPGMLCSFNLQWQLGGGGCAPSNEECHMRVTMIIL